jgi:hypothetical protein
MQNLATKPPFSHVNYKVAVIAFSFPKFCSRYAGNEQFRVRSFFPTVPAAPLNWMHAAGATRVIARARIPAKIRPRKLPKHVKQQQQKTIIRRRINAAWLFLWLPRADLGQFSYARRRRRRRTILAERIIRAAYLFRFLSHTHRPNVKHTFGVF